LGRGLAPPTGAALAVPQFVADKLEAAAGVRQPLLLRAKTNPDVRAMDGRFQVIAEAAALPAVATSARATCAVSSRR